MLREQAKLFNRLAVLGDAFLLMGALYMAYLFRLNWNGGGGRDFLDYVWILIIAIPVWFLLFTRYGLYASMRRLTIFEIVTRSLNVHFLGALACAAFIFLLDREEYSRAIYGGFIVFSFIFITLERVLVRGFLGYFRSKGYNTRNLLIVGTREKARRFHQMVEDHREWGMEIEGFLQADESQPLQEGEIDGHLVLGYARDLIKICKSVQIDEVVFCLPKNMIIDVDDYVRDLEEIGITVQVVLDFFDIQSSKQVFGLFHNEIPIITFHTKSLDAQQLFLKRVLDIVGALIGLAMTAVLLPFIALAIKRSDPGPLFFGQNRVGENGRIFKCWKFRTMYTDAEERKKELMARNEMKGAIFKIKNDPRIFPFGHFLRKTSLDELPQFWNVLKGEMSLVGTRPPTPGEVSEYENWHRRRISIKPGITGLWQISGRNNIDDFDEIVRMDLSYIDTWNIWLDIRLLCKTVAVVLRRKGSS